MRILSTICLTFLFITAKAQTDTLISFSGVQNVDGVKASTLFLRAQLWINDNFISGKDVTQFSDKENGILTGRGAFLLPYKFDYYTKREGLTRFAFSIKIIVKDERYKYEFSYFDHVQGIDDDPAYKIGVLSTASKSPNHWHDLPKRIPNEVWESTKAGLKIKVDSLGMSLHKAMLTKIETKDF